MAVSRLSLMAMKNGDGKPKKIKNDKETNTQYGIYSGIVNKEGKTVDKPKESEAISNMADYMKNNTPESNVYRSKFSH